MPLHLTGEKQIEMKESQDEVGGIWKINSAHRSCGMGSTHWLSRRSLRTCWKCDLERKMGTGDGGTSPEGGGEPGCAGYDDDFDHTQCNPVLGNNNYPPPTPPDSPNVP